MYVDVSRGVRLSVVFAAHPLFAVLGESRRGHDHRKGNQDESKGVTYWHEVFLIVYRNAKAEERASANESGRAQPMQDPSATPVTCFCVWGTALNRAKLECPSRGPARYALVERHLLIGGETPWIREAAQWCAREFLATKARLCAWCRAWNAAALRRDVRRRKCASCSLQIASSEPRKAHLNR
ncbi:hypothetical protein [Caballeronia grimmiae]|uniref:hypothetical protein n=1 Tax=Caballeronia grimmiae TaxID=1071679 RepID=UPI001FCF9725|nr:hypothetical protein [Caballeronia grimmiae]